VNFKLAVCLPRKCGKEVKLDASFDFFFLMGFVGFWNFLIEMIGLEFGIF